MSMLYLGIKNNKQNVSNVLIILHYNDKYLQLRKVILQNHLQFYGK